MKKLIPLILILLCPFNLSAQKINQQEVFEIAETMYNHGYFDGAADTLLTHINSLRGLHRSSAFRLIALCRLETGRLEDAKTYVDQLLKADPYYTPTLNDPQRFIDLVNEAKQQEAGITTASRQAESVDEAPVPVTVITEDMIRYSGANTLQELLCLYVPGMSNAEGMESNIAMHGLSGLSQEMILFLQDGHRLNSSSTNAEAPDFRNSLDKIQQIEVLRGPASSLYGNVALTAVVNIITYKGAKLNGGHISATTGTQKTYGGSFVVGGGNNVVDITGWGSINTSEGFKHVIANDVTGGTTTLYSHGFNRRPSYDIGIKGRWGDFTMTINSQRSKQTPYFNVIQVAADQTLTVNPDFTSTILPEGGDFNAIQNFNYDKYPSLNSNGPGTTRTNHHINLDYSHSFNKFDLQASGYISLENTSLYNVLGDSVDENIAISLLNRGGVLDDQTSAALLIYKEATPIYSMVKSYINTIGTFEAISWEDISFGGQIQALTKYNFLGYGTAVFGAQYEHSVVTDGTLFIGGNYNVDNTITKGDIFESGSEDIISGYAQIKHYFMPKLILNAGLRYDHKRQFNDHLLDYLSPRASLIYKFTDEFSARASYNYSFVDAPYLYRSSKIILFSGGSELKPETMKSLQASIAYRNVNSHFTAELSGYYNIASDLLTQSSSFSASSYTFQSSGKLRQFVVEAASQYVLPRFMLNANATWQKIVKYKQECKVYYGNKLGMPQLMGNVAVAWAPYVGKSSGFFGSGKLWLNGTVSAQSKTYYQKVDLLRSASGDPEGGTEIVGVNPQILLGIGCMYEWKHLDISLNLKNITNNQYNVGSNMSMGIPHVGRQLLGKVTIKF